VSQSVERFKHSSFRFSDTAESINQDEKNSNLTTPPVILNFKLVIRLSLKTCEGRTLAYFVSLIIVKDKGFCVLILETGLMLLTSQGLIRISGIKRYWVFIVSHRNGSVTIYDKPTGIIFDHKQFYILVSSGRDVHNTLSS
jgi:hypothetical protein